MIPGWLVAQQISIEENLQFTIGCLDPRKRSISNRLTLELNDGSVLENVIVKSAIGHKRRRNKEIPKLIEKFKTKFGGKVFCRTPKYSFEYLSCLYKTVKYQFK